MLLFQRAAGPSLTWDGGRFPSRPAGTLVVIFGSPNTTTNVAGVPLKCEPLVVPQWKIVSPSYPDGFFFPTCGRG